MNGYGAVLAAGGVVLVLMVVLCVLDLAFESGVSDVQAEMARLRTLADLPPSRAKLAGWIAFREELIECGALSAKTALEVRETTIDLSYDLADYHDLDGEDIGETFAWIDSGIEYEIARREWEAR